MSSHHHIENIPERTHAEHQQKLPARSHQSTTIIFSHIIHHCHSLLQYSNQENSPLGYTLLLATWREETPIRVSRVQEGRVLILDVIGGCSVYRRLNSPFCGCVQARYKNSLLRVDLFHLSFCFPVSFASSTGRRIHHLLMFSVLFTS